MNGATRHSDEQPAMAAGSRSPGIKAVASTKTNGAKTASNTAGTLKPKYSPRRSPKRMVALIILVLMAAVTSFVEFPIIPGTDWLMYDPSGIIVLVAAFIFGPWIGAAVAVLAWIPHFATNPLGTFMNIMFSVSFVLVMGLIYRQYPSFKRALLGVLAGIVAATVVSICLNFVVTPLYLDVAYEQVAASVLPTLLPFNLIKAAINGAVALIAYKKVISLLDSDEKTKEPGE